MVDMVTTWADVLGSHKAWARHPRGVVDEAGVRLEVDGDGAEARPLAGPRGCSM